MRKKILRILPRKQIERIANVRWAWFYSRTRLEEIIVESWPEAAIVDAFADLMDSASHQHDDDEEYE